MLIELRDCAFDPWQEIVNYQQSMSIDDSSKPNHKSAAGKYGATAVFVGTMRDFNQDNTVSKMFLEHYPGMTEKQLQILCQGSLEIEDVLDILVIHRVGEIFPDEPIVLVAVWSAHRKAAFEQSRHIMEELKSNAPFWKKETLQSGASQWVSGNTAGY